MTPPLPNLRYEKKFIAEGCTLAEALARVRRHPSVFREAYPPRVVNNIYLDSPTRRDYHDHVNGAANRTKTRVRWYGPEFELAEKPALERKLKCGLVSGKAAYGLHRLGISGGCLGSRLRTHFDAASLPPMLHFNLRHLEPALFNRYFRHYFLSRDGRFRLTVDSHLQFAGVHSHCRETIGFLHPASTVIIELKFEPEHAEDAAGVTNALPFRLARFSKYIEGLDKARCGTH